MKEQFEGFEMYIKANKKWQPVLNIAMIIVGCLVMGFGFSVFFEPNNITTGGFSGIAMMINSLLQRAGVKFISSSLIYLVINLILYIIAIKSMGKVFAINAIVGIGAFSGAMELFTLIPKFGDFDLIISALFGGVLMGFGLGIVIRFGGSTGGSDMIACILRKKYPSLHIGRIVVCIDIVVVFMSLFVFNNGVDLFPYTIIALALSSVVTDYVNEGYKQIRAYTIITSKPREIAGKIMEVLVRGCTLSEVKGMHSDESRACLVCLISKYQVGTMKNIIAELDPKAFVYSTAVSEVIGEWRKDPHDLLNEELEEKMKIKRKKKPAKEKSDAQIEWVEGEKQIENEVVKPEEIEMSGTEKVEEVKGKNAKQKTSQNSSPKTSTKRKQSEPKAELKRKTKTKKEETG